MQTNTYLTTSAFTNPFLSSLGRRRRSENIIAILNLFFHPRHFTLNFWCEVFDIRDQGPWTGTRPRCLRLNESCFNKSFEFIAQNACKIIRHDGGLKKRLRTNPLPSNRPCTFQDCMTSFIYWQALYIVKSFIFFNKFYIFCNKF